MIKIARFSLNSKMALGRNKQMDELQDFLNKIGAENIIQITACPETFMTNTASQTLYTVFYKE